MYEVVGLFVPLVLIYEADTFALLLALKLLASRNIGARSAVVMRNLLAGEELHRYFVALTAIPVAGSSSSPFTTVASNGPGKIFAN